MSAAPVLDALARLGLTVAVAESLTGGALASHLIEVPGASAVVRGGVVAYATDLKTSLLGVDRPLLEDRGPVDATVAQQMADGVRLRLGADVGVATTGVAGPAAQAGQCVGTIFVAVTTAQCTAVRELRLAGGRAQLRRAAVLAATALLRGTVAEGAGADRSARGNKSGGVGV